MILLSATLPLWRPAKEAHCRCLIPAYLHTILGVHDLHQSVYLSFMYFYTFKAPLRGCARIYTPPGTLAMGRGVTPFTPRGEVLPGVLFRLRIFLGGCYSG